MKNLLTLAFVAFFAFAFTPNNVGEGTSVNTSKSVITWKGYKVTGEHAGTLKVKSGDLNFTDGKLTGGNFVIDMASLAVTDLKGGGAKKLAGHLKSPDFFGTEKYPTAKFKITKVVSRGKAGEYKITGNVTIKETTKEIKFNTIVTEENGVKTAKADITLDRSDFNVRYGSGSFFDGLGDKTIYDEFDLSVSLVVK
ncbi:MAG: YceI family protein [Saprospiraceae bacterium]